MRPVQHTPKRPESRLRAALVGTTSAAALLFAVGAAAQSGATAPVTNGNGQNNNLTRQVQNETAIQLPSLAPLVDRVSPAVVTITAHITEGGDGHAELNRDSDEDQGSPDQSFRDRGSRDHGSRDQGSRFDDLLRRFFENRGMPQRGRDVVALGSGFIVDPTGYIVTNQHVVGTSDKVTVILHDNTKHSAKVIGRDEKTDLALIKIDAPNKLPFVTWGDSEQAKVGDWVVAVGNPFGLGGTVTAGIISALGRNINEGPYDDFIQIDAPINRGNSGGPAFDLSGRVIGINTAIYSPSGGSVGIGFAIPANSAKPVVDQLREHGHVTRGWLGVAIQGITPPIAKSLGIDPNAPTGALVAAVSPDSPAAKAGLKQGDVILSVNNHPIKSVNDLPRLVANTPVGDKLQIEIRRNGKDETVQAQVAQMRDNQQASADTGGNRDDAGAASLGLDLAPLDEAVRSRFHVPRQVEGVVVAGIANDSPLADLGLEPGDVIQSVDQHPVKTPQEAAAQLKDAAGKGNILLLLNRHGSSQFVGLSVGPGSTSGSSAPH